MKPLPAVVIVPRLLMVLLLATSMPVLVPITEAGPCTLTVNPFCAPLP
jgi:hypothetical protein